ncbi:Inositol polyphosphate multikinase [Sciurus carolinensis]|uniref:Inositol polyphosphate multikinase n=1 Tax=Sciurus carolinensis TaxID=30640 RepID=A0AA41MK56_SCICA|nr:Inositol polyphosphate multikinase [Sciurus carolinensis]
MATEPPAPLRLESPGSPEMRMPRASDATPEGTLQPAGGRLLFFKAAGLCRIRCRAHVRKGQKWVYYNTQMAQF